MRRLPVLAEPEWDSRRQKMMDAYADSALKYAQAAALDANLCLREMGSKSRWLEVSALLYRAAAIMKGEA